MVIYNYLWGIAWFTFMRREWVDAAAAVGKSMPWTAEIWFVWVTLTLLLGFAVMAYAAGRPGAEFKASLSAMVVVWLPFGAGMAVWGYHESFPVSAIAMDTGVNLISMLAASLVGAWSVRRED